jgi:tetratricopeptide (TPR) repeat protein
MISGSLCRGCPRRGPSRIIQGGRMARWALPAVFAVVVLGGRAQAMQLTPVQKQEMKQHYEKATRAYDVQKYSEAVEEYQKAYEIGGDPAMLYNVAQSYRLSDQLPEALRFYRRYLQRSPNARNRDDVERKISDLERTLEERRKAAAAVPPPPPPEPVVVPPPPPPRPVKTGGGGKRIAGIVLASLGGAALVTAGITGQLAKSKGDKLTTASMRGERFDPNLEANGKTLNTITIVSAIAGAAAVVTGAVLIVLSLGGDSEDVHASASPSVSPVIGIGLVGAAATVRF